jgi:hypothetical protein
VDGVYRGALNPECFYVVNAADAPSAAVSQANMATYSALLLESAGNFEVELVTKDVD